MAVDFESHLAPYAMRTAASRGRRYPEPEHPFRTLYQRDRERIVHSSAFRRMTGKTQVLAAILNDHHRTRLTHTLEVAQIARTVARRLRLNEDLVEAIALAHDIGHPPYGHAGEQALHECLIDEGGFNHNLDGLRRVDWLEDRYPDFPGLNLSFEVREAFIRHYGDLTAREAAEFADCGGPLLEAEVVDAVDSIAYNTHDVDDALGLGHITMDDLAGVRLIARARQAVETHHPRLPAEALRKAMLRQLLAIQVDALLKETARRIAAGRINSLADVRASIEPLVGMAEPIANEKAELELFLQQRVYRHPAVLRMTSDGRRVLHELFAGLVARPECMPERFLARWRGAAERFGDRLLPQLPHREPRDNLPRVVADYIAGMTDRFAVQEHTRLFKQSQSA